MLNIKLSNSFQRLKSTWLKAFVVVILLTFSNSCTHLKKLSSVESDLRNIGTFESYLALEYLDFSRALSNKNSWRYADYFSQKGLGVAASINLVPEDPIEWSIKEEQIGDLILTQKRLEILSTKFMKGHLPIQLAHLWMLYDCWVFNEAKPNINLGEFSKCKGRFYRLLEEMEQYLEIYRKPKVAKTEIQEVKFDRYEILFDLDSYKINDSELKKLTQLLDYLNKLNANYQLLLVGTSDKSGAELYNDNLALKRVETVYNYLTKNGVWSELIEVRSFGENFPDILTSKDLPHLLNRTVGIYITKGRKAVTQIPMPLIENQVYRSEIEKTLSDDGMIADQQGNVKTKK